MLEPGETVLIPSGPIHDPHRMHLHIVAARKTGPPPQILLVSVCSIRADQSYDESTVFVGGEHPFIQHPTYVRYRAARVENEADIERGIQNGYFESGYNCSNEVLARVRSGFGVSRFAPPFTNVFLNEAE